MYRIGQDELDEIDRLFRSKKIFRAESDLREVENLEKEWAQKIGVRYAVAVTGGTSALICALVGLGIGPGDEVIVPGYTFMASATAVLAVGAIPVIAEVDDTLAIDPADVEAKIGPHTKAVMPVHMIGRPADMGRIMDIARRKGILVLEDACQADGGSYKEKRLGSWGNAGAFSFNYYKIISAGEGGAVVSDDRKVYERALIHHDSGIAFRFSAKELATPVFLGQQYRMSEIIGAVLRMQVRRLDGILSDLRKARRRLLDGLSGVPGAVPLRDNDPEGDCGQTLGFRFDSEKRARAFAGAEGVHGSLPIDSDKHVYSNWTPILEKRGAHHPALDPFRLPQNAKLRMDYRTDMCPRTLEHLKRTVFLSINPDWTEEEAAGRVAACRAGLSKALS